MSSFLFSESSGLSTVSSKSKSSCFRGEVLLSRDAEYLFFQVIYGQMTMQSSAGHGTGLAFVMDSAKYVPRPEEIDHRWVMKCFSRSLQMSFVGFATLCNSTLLLGSHRIAYQWPVSTKMIQKHGRGPSTAKLCIRCHKGYPMRLI